MTRRLLPLSAFFLCLIALMFSLGCEGGPPYGDPLYIHEGDNPFDQPDLLIKSIAVEPTGVNLAVGGLQRFKATANFNNGTFQDYTAKVEWYTENPSVGTFETVGSKFLAQRPGVAIIRCRIKQLNSFAISNAAFVNSFNPNMDNPPAVPQNPSLTVTPEGVVVDWDLNNTDIDLAGYNLYRTQVSTSHYAINFDATALGHYASDHRVNEQLILYPPYLDKTVVSGWYYYRVTAEDLLGLQSAPSEEVETFVTFQSHYGGSYDGNSSSVQDSAYKDALTTAF
jgi:hypothetical protein